jgi:prepilin-type N-terminal cleavage/methylation domain-containing protein
MLKRMRGERGFTLVELLVVLAILAILVALVIPNLTGLLGGALETAMNQEKDTVQTAIDVYMTQDYAIHGSASIAPAWAHVSLYTQVGSADPSDFGIYLQRTSKYYYCWGVGGAGLSVTNVPNIPCTP